MHLNLISNFIGPPEKDRNGPPEKDRDGPPPRAVTVTVTTASPAVVSCHRSCLLPPAVVHVTSHTL